MALFRHVPCSTTIDCGSLVVSSDSGGSMVTVQFLRTGDKPLRTLGPFPWVRVHNGSLRAGPDDDEVAHHRGGVWYAGEVSAPKYAIHGSACTLRVQGEGPAESAIL